MNVDLSKCDAVTFLIQESARSHPSLHLTFPEKTPQDSYIGSYLIPSGTIVLIDADTINNRFDNADYLSPERFNSITKKMIHRFGLGQRACLGQKFADLILQQCLFNIVRRVILVNPHEMIGMKTSGSCFFTPYLKFPTVSVTYRSVVLCGLSLGNSYYNEKNINNIFTKWSGNTPKLVTFIPDDPSFHTYMAKLGNNLSETERSSKANNINKKCRNDSAVLMKRAEGCSKGKDFKFINARWNDIVNMNKVIYDASLTDILSLYKTSSKFKQAVGDVTLEVISISGNLSEGVMFLLKELAFIVKAPEILDCHSVIYSYHKSFSVVDNVLSGELDYPRVNNVFTRTVY